MKIGVISDVHSNIDALNKVLEEFKNRKIEKIICCGDIIGIGCFPEETVQKLIEYEDKLIAVRGNHEQYFFKGIPKEIHDDKRPIREEEIKNHKWTHGSLSNTSIDFLRSLPLEQNIEIEGKKIYIAHYPIYEDGTYRKHIKKANAEEIQELFSYKDADIYFYGHTHIENINTIDGKLYINPGSLGCPGTSNIAKCGILTIDGKVSYEEINVEYNTQKVIEEIKETKYPLYKKMLTLFYGVNDEMVQVLGEYAQVEKIQKTKYSNLYEGEILYNNERINAYVIGDEIKDSFHGKIMGLIDLKKEVRLIVSNVKSDLDYAHIKEYFKEMEDVKSAKFRCFFEKSAGAIIYKLVDGEPQYLIIYSKKDIPGFPKGHVEAGESTEQAAKREILEEVGLKVDFKKNFKESIYYYVDDKPIQKEVVFYLAEIPVDAEVKIDEDEINKYEFMSFEQAKNVLKENLVRVLEKAEKYVLNL